MKSIAARILHAGIVNAYEEPVAYNGPGVFTQTGGTNNTVALQLGSFGNAAISGTYILCNGVLNAQQENLQSPSTRIAEFPREIAANRCRVAT